MGHALFFVKIKLSNFFKIPSPSSCLWWIKILRILSELLVHPEGRGGPRPFFVKIQLSNFFKIPSPLSCLWWIKFLRILSELLGHPDGRGGPRPFSAKIKLLAFFKNSLARGRALDGYRNSTRDCEHQKWLAWTNYRHSNMWPSAEAPPIFNLPSVGRVHT